MSHMPCYILLRDSISRLIRALVLWVCILPLSSVEGKVGHSKQCDPDLYSPFMGNWGQQPLWHSLMSPVPVPTSNYVFSATGWYWSLPWQARTEGFWKSQQKFSGFVCWIVSVLIKTGFEGTKFSIVLEFLSAKQKNYKVFLVECLCGE